jgi:hypothetical protein
MYLTNMEIVKSIGFGIYLYSMFIYLKELFEGIRYDRPKMLSEWFWYAIFFLGSCVPILNTIVAYQIIKPKK